MIPKPSKGGDFKPAPAGTKACRMIDWEDLGLVETQFGPKEKIRFVFQTPDTFKKDDNHLNYNVSQRYTKSLHEKSRLLPVVEALLGRKLRATDYGPEGFDPETLVGKCALVSIEHSDPVGEDKRIYANIKGMIPLPDGMEEPAGQNPNYTRIKDRDDDEKVPF